jgi:predicted nucleic acid-binding protein
MIVLDTNVLSEPLRRQPDSNVLAWLTSLDEETVVTAVSIGELLTGVRALPEGRRRAGLLDAIDMTLQSFAGSVLAYDEVAARHYARLQQARRAAGRPLAVEDGMIAATCIAHGATLATRNTDDFTGLHLALIDPWDVAGRAPGTRST